MLDSQRERSVLSRAKHDASGRRTLTLSSDICYVRRLPLELIELVFRYARELDPPHNYPGFVYLGWLRVLSVCSWWRSAAIQCNRLWNNISGPGLTLPWVFRMVEYSKSSLLSLSVSSSQFSSASEDHSLNRLLGTVASRLRHLHLMIDDEDEQGVVASLREAPVAFEMLSLTITSRNAAILLPTDLFSCGIPRLRRLTLIDCFVPWDAPLYDHLGHLSIHLTPHAAHSIGYAEVQDEACSSNVHGALRRMAPTLRSLSLRNIQPFTTGLESAFIDLPTLDSLTLEESPADCITIMHSFSFPPSANIALYLDSGHADTLVDTMHTLGITSMSIRALELDFDHGSGYQFTMRLHPPASRGCGVCTMYVNRTAHSSRWITCKQYVPLVRALRLTETTTLIHHASNWRFWAADTWRSLQLPRLRRLAAVGIPASISLLDALAGNPVLAPKLEHLRVARTPPEYSFFSPRPEVLDLKKFLEIREDLGHPVADAVAF